MADKSKADNPILTCGLIMPISTTDSCTAEHWDEVKQIITEAIESITDPKFSIKLVSESDDIGVIQKRIVQSVYTSDIVVCDVSGKNPNVMFELGMRLAFDKPTVIVKDDKTDYSFDTGIIEHIPYPRDLHYQRMVAFKKSLCTKISATHKSAHANPQHSTFLKNFGTFKVTSLSETEASPHQIQLDMLNDILQQLARLNRRMDQQQALDEQRIGWNQLLNTQLLHTNAIPLSAIGKGQNSLITIMNPNPDKATGSINPKPILDENK